MSKRSLIFSGILFLIVFGIFAVFSVSAAEECWQYDGNQSSCQTAIDSGMDCLWSPSSVDPMCPDAIGCCITKGCWQFDKNQTNCESSAGCTWLSNDKSQNPWCWNNVGCCDKKGCWNFINTNQTACESAFNGICEWNDATDPWCPESIGCCHPKLCNSLNETQCSSASNYDVPCSWNNVTSSCGDEGFDFYDDETSCMNSGGQWNSATQSCEMATFDDFIHCWFADFKPSICGNITGCVYCTSQKTTDSSSACYNDEEGLCQGHEVIPGATDIAQDSLACGDILIEQLCNCGPVPNCKWNGTGCTEGILTSSEKNKCKPPVNFCDEATNKSVCDELGDIYFMPCMWDNQTNKCEFEKDFVFGGSSGKFEDISDEDSCIMSGGSWVTGTFIENDVVKNNGWCEIGSGEGMEQCDDSCWACEWKDSNGNDVTSLAEAQTACANSALGFCEFKPDSYAFNGYGWCDYPKEFLYGGGDCEANCNDCSFMNDPQTSCENSAADCKWVNDVSGSWCESKDKKTCIDDCFSCYDEQSCTTKGMGGNSCTWDSAFFYCKPSGFSGEVCFDAMDNDGDGEIDCGDPDCSFDSFCGGFMLSNCGQYNETECPTIAAPGGNCTWIVDPFGGEWCDMPGANCWMYADNKTGCKQTSGCNWINVSEKGDIPFCDINKTSADVCFQSTDNASCNNNSNCRWITDSGGGFCDFWIFNQCSQHNPQPGEDISNKKAECIADTNCTWHSDPFGEFGSCDPACFNENLNTSECNNMLGGGICESRNAVCEPEFSMEDCPESDGNKTACLARNITCEWHQDAHAPGSGENQGFCDKKGGFMLFEKMDPSPPVRLGDDLSESELVNTPEVDITYFGMKDMGDSYGFGIGVRNVTNAVVCNGYKTHTNLPLGEGTEVSESIGNGANTTKFYWYFDTDGNASNGCYANGVNQTDLGYEFFIKYITKVSSNKTIETKVFNKCNNGTWVPTNIFLSSDKPKGCMMVGGVIMAIEKGSLEKFAGYDKKANMRIYIASADELHNSTTPSDSAGPASYTPGSIDVKFECCDCPGQDMDNDGFNSENDPDCKFVKQFGYIPFEDCVDNKDNNGDGLVDCDDSMCSFTPMCGGSFGFNIDQSDKTAPKIIFHDIDTFFDGAFIKFDTDEPTNGTIEFYKNDSTCNTLNKSLVDKGDPSSTFDDYKPFHGVPIDNFQSNPQKLGYDLQNGTPYYYKIKVYDPSNNFATSVCLNFTTETSSEEFVFDMDIPSGYKVDIPALNVLDDNFTYGKKTNITKSKNINITVKCPASGYEMTFVNVDILSAKDIDLEDAFVCDNVNELIGMNSDKWQKLLYELHVEYVILNIEATGDKLLHCDENGENCTDVTSYADCTFTSTNTICKIPVSLGFSTYKVSQTTITTSSSGGGGSSRTTTTWQCNDGIDNDGDGLIDLKDMGCSSSTDNNETNAKIQVKSQVKSCMEEWSCTEWSSCTSGVQKRTCRDKNKCGTIKNKPKIIKTCQIAAKKTVAKEKKEINEINEIKTPKITGAVSAVKKEKKISYTAFSIIILSIAIAGFLIGKFIVSLKNK